MLFRAWSEVAGIGGAKPRPLGLEVAYRLAQEPAQEAVEGRGRARAVNGTISYMPPLFGLMLAGAVVQQLIAEH